MCGGIECVYGCVIVCEQVRGVCESVPAFGSVCTGDGMRVLCECVSVYTREQTAERVVQECSQLPAGFVPRHVGGVGGRETPKRVFGPLKIRSRSCWALKTFGAAEGFSEPWGLGWEGPRDGGSDPEQKRILFS